MNSIKKIVLVGTQPPMIGGISTHIKSLKTRLRQHGFEVTVLDVFNTRKDRKQKDGEVLSGKNPVKLWKNIFKLARNGFEIFHFHSSKRAYAFLTAVIWVRLLNKKVILSLHHGGFNGWLQKHWWRKIIYLTFFSLADKIIFMNPDDAETFKEISHFSKHKILSIPPFIVEDEKYYRAHYPTDNHEEKLLITTMGGWRVFYLLENVITACLKLKEQLPFSIELDIIAGTSEMSEAYKQKIIEMAEAKSTEDFCISIMENKEDILPYLAGRDVMVRSSKTDSYGLCVAESLMMGVPAIATDVCNRPANTILYKPHDVKELTRLLKNVLEKYKNRKFKKSMITKADDAYYYLDELYKSL